MPAPKGMREVKGLADLEGVYWGSTKSCDPPFRPYRVNNGVIEVFLNDEWKVWYYQSLDDAFNIGAPKYVPAEAEEGRWVPVEIKSIDDLDVTERYRVNGREFIHKAEVGWTATTGARVAASVGYLYGCIESEAPFEVWQEPVAPREVTFEGIKLSEFRAQPSLANNDLLPRSEPILAAAGFKPGDKVTVTVREAK